MVFFLLGHNLPLCIRNGTRFVVFGVSRATGERGGGIAGAGEGKTNRVTMRGMGVGWWCRAESDKDGGRDGDDR